MMHMTFGGVKTMGLLRALFSVRLAVALLTATALACTDDPGATVATVADSAGIRVLTYDLTHGIAVPTYRVVAEPDLVIGAQDGAPEYSFSRVPAVSVAGDGTLLVVDGVAREIRVYGGDGTWLRTIGRGGEGPGEFAAAPYIVGLSGDSVFAFDSRSGRVTSFTVGGELLAMMTLGSGSAARPVFIIRQRDGGYLSQSPWVNPASSFTIHDVRLDVDSIVIERLDSSGELVDTLRVMPDRTQARMSQDLGGGRVRTLQAAPPFRPRGFLRSDGRRAILAHSASFEIRLLRPSGEPGTIVRVLGAENAMSGTEMRTRQEASVLEEFGADLDPMTRRLMLDFLPERLPAFDAVVIAANGDVWVSRAEFDAAAGYEWLVFDPAGVLRGLVRTPGGFQLFQVTGETILGVYGDELDVPYVQRYSLIKE